MEITRTSTVSEVAVAAPATIRVFQQREIDFCCGGRRMIGDVCADRGLDVDALVAELRAAVGDRGPERNWTDAPLAGLVAHIQARFHDPLRRELPRLGQMLVKVVTRHHDGHPETRHVQDSFDGLHVDLLHHMQKEDAVLFPAILALEAGGPAPGGNWGWIDQPIDVMEAEHEEAGRALRRMRELTEDYTPPVDACPTFRGLYDGLAELEREMHIHVHLENHVLFPRAAALARSR